MTTLLTKQKNAALNEVSSNEAIEAAINRLIASQQNETEAQGLGDHSSLVSTLSRSEEVQQTHTPKQQEPSDTKVLVFNRSEKKYLISAQVADTFMSMLGADLIQDKRGSTIIRNLYLDTPDFGLIRRSIEKPLYKEKLRVRTYGEVEGPQHEAFVEIKKKFDGQVYKRRLALPLIEAERFIQGEIEPEGQIARELAWSIQSYSPLEPAISVIYERRAFTYPGLDGNVRITFDGNLAAKLGSRTDFYLPSDSSAYQLLLPQDHYVMEIKVLGAIPLELVDILSRLEIYPQSFSKVGTAFKRLHQRT